MLMSLFLELTAASFACVHRIWDRNQKSVIIPFLYTLFGRFCSSSGHLRVACEAGNKLIFVPLSVMQNRTEKGFFCV